MADNSKIEWTDATWSPVTGCDQVSPGCDHCYALTLAKRLKAIGSAKYQNDGDPRTSGPGFGVTVHPDALAIPLRWRKSRQVFVNPMGDLFHDSVPDEFIAQVFGVMCATPRHTYQVLTKRHARLRSLLNNYGWWTLVVYHALGYEDEPGGGRRGPVQTQPDGCALLNVWLGVSAEDQKWADIRVPALLDTPAAVRFVSAEPLLGPLSLSRYLPRPFSPLEWAESGEPDPEDYPPSLAWVIVGGESGPGARVMAMQDATRIVQECRRANVPVFMKQLGAITGREWGAGSKGGDWDTWPEFLKVREFPRIPEVVAS